MPTNKEILSLYYPVLCGIMREYKVIRRTSPGIEAGDVFFIICCQMILGLYSVSARYQVLFFQRPSGVCIGW